MTDTPQFAMADAKWQELKTQYGLTDRHMVDMFIRPFLQEIAARGPIQFASDPRITPEASLLGEQWRILRDDMGYVYDVTAGHAIALNQWDPKR